MNNIPQRASAFLAGKGPGIIPKKRLYESEVDHLRLKIATDHGYLSWEAYREVKLNEIDSFYKSLGCK